MPKHWIEYAETWRDEPLAFWVHRQVDSPNWRDAFEFDPPAPAKEPGKGFPIYLFEIDGFTFRFSSIPQIEHCVDIFSQKNLPQTRSLSESRCDNYGPNTHWLSRLPANTKSWKYREKAIKYLEKVLNNLRGDGT